MIQESRLGNNFEKKRGLIIVTERVEIDLAWLTVARTGKKQNTNAHSLLGDIYTRIGDTTKAMHEYIQAFKQCAEGEFPDDRIGIHEKMLWILQSVSDVSKNDSLKRY